MKTKEVLYILSYEDLIESDLVCPKCGFSKAWASRDDESTDPLWGGTKICCQKCFYEDDWWRFYEKINSLVEQLEQINDMKDALS